MITDILLVLSGFSLWFTIHICAGVNAAATLNRYPEIKRYRHEWRFMWLPFGYRTEKKNGKVCMYIGHFGDGMKNFFEECFAEKTPE